MIEIYGRSDPRCAYCVRAKNLAEISGLEYKYYDLNKDEWGIEELSKVLGHQIRTVPVVLVDGHYIGGADDLFTFIKWQID